MVDGSGFALSKKTALSFESVHPGENKDTKPRRRSFKNYRSDLVFGWQLTGVAVTYRLSLRLMLSSFDLTKTASSPPLTRSANSPSLALKITLK